MLECYGYTFTFNEPEGSKGTADQEAMKPKKILMELECSICPETYTRPKVLDCNHIFCLQCLVKLVQKNQDHRGIVCPQCRSVTPVPASGVKELKSDFRENQLLEIVNPQKKDLSIASVKEVSASPIFPNPSHLAIEIRQEDNLTWSHNVIGVLKMECPVAIAVNKQGKLVVTEKAKDCVSVFDSKPEKLLSFATHGQNIQTPYGIAIDDKGNVYTSDYYKHCFQKFTSEGDFTVSTASSSKKRFERPRGITFNSSNGYLYASSDNEGIQIFDSDLNNVGSFGTRGSDKGELNNPQHIACDSIGNVYVADRYNNRIQVFTATGEFLRMFGSCGKGNDNLSQPYGIAIDSGNDRVYVSEHSNNRISVFTREGNFLTSFGCTGMELGQFRGCRGLAVDNKGVLYVCDKENNRVQLIRMHSAVK